MFKVKATVISFLGDKEKYPCHHGYRLGDGGRHASTFSLASSIDKNQLSLRHSSLNLPLKDSIKALSVGFLERLKSRELPIWVFTIVL
jgi:hypothetical protein